MNSQQDLKSQIDYLMTSVRLMQFRLKHCQAMADLLKRRGQEEATELQTAVDSFKAQGRTAVFELMLCSSHRSFMRFLREHDHSIGD